MSKYMINVYSSLKPYNDFLKEMKSFYNKNIQYFDENLIVDSVFEELNETAINMNNLAEVKKESLKCINLGGRIMKFYPDLDKIFLGETTVIDTRIISTILDIYYQNDNQTKAELVFVSTVLTASYENEASIKNQVKDLISLCEFAVDQTWNLIYKASQDGFEAAKFHAKCDNKPNTLILINSTNGNIFGGYTEQSWYDNGEYKAAKFHTNCDNKPNTLTVIKSTNGNVFGGNTEEALLCNGIYKADPNSFIFSLINKKNKPIKIKCSKNCGIYCKSSYGPTFGGGRDLHIADESNTNSRSYSNLGHSYSHPDYAYGSNEAISFLAGSYNFQVLEIEVYTKQ